MNDLKSRASGALTRRMAAGVCALVVGLALVGCTRPEPEPVVTPSTPTISDMEPQLVGAVKRYLEVSSEIGQNVDTADWEKIREVARDQVVEDNIALWTDWSDKGWHMVGSPTITVNNVTEAFQDWRGYGYSVHTCFNMSNVYLADANGNQVSRAVAEHSLQTFTVLVTIYNAYFVIDDVEEEGAC